MCKNSMVLVHYCSDNIFFKVSLSYRSSYLQKLVHQFVTVRHATIILLQTSKIVVLTTQIAKYLLSIKTHTTTH